MVRFLFSSLVVLSLIAVAAPGAAADDPVTCQGQPATIVGTARNDTIKGTAGPDVIVGLAGNDTINGLAGDDVICADEPDGANPVWGNDQVNAGQGSDSVVGAAGDDVVNGGGSSPGNGDALDVGIGDDRIVDRGDGDAYITTGDGANVVVTDVTGEVDLSAGAGDDTLNITAGGSLNGNLGAGGDRLTATIGGDINADLSDGFGRFGLATGGDDRATLTATGDINLRSGTGSSVVRAEAFNTMNFGGGAGNDTIIDSDPDGPVNASLGAGDDSFRGSDQAAHGDVNIAGNGGNDVIVLPDSGPDAGNAVMSGGSGDDRIVTSDRTSYLYGGTGNDTLVGRNGDDYLSGDGGNRGGFVRAAVIGGGDDGGVDGNDTLTGGGGSDAFVAGGRDDIINARDMITDQLFTCGDGQDTLRADKIQDVDVNRDGCGEARFSVTINGRSITALTPPTSVATFVLRPGETTASEWLTAANRTRLTSKVSARPDLSTTDAPADGAPEITVDLASTRQTIEGFGGAMTQSAAWLLQHATPGRRAAMLNALFSPTGAALDYVRVPMGASDLATEDYTYDPLPFFEFTDTDLNRFTVAHDDADIVPTLQQAQAINPAIKLISAPWSAPGWMKIGGTFHGTDCGGNGNYLAQDYYPVYARYFLKFLQAYRERGLPVSVVSMQNEPHNCKGDVPTMRMEISDQADLAKILRPLLDDNGFADTRILTWDHNWYENGSTLGLDPDLDYETFYPQQAVDQADGAISAVGYHCYNAGDHPSNGEPSKRWGVQSDFHGTHPEADVYFTECTGSVPDNADDINVAGNLVNETRDDLIGPIRNWARTSLYWSLVLDTEGRPRIGGCPRCRGMLAIDRAADTWQRNEDYYYWSQFSRFVDRGASVIQTTEPDDNGLMSTAFRNPGGAIVVVVLNTASG